jgi:hypothetical protein
MHTLILRQELESAFNQRGSFIGVSRSQAKSIPRYGPRANILKLDQILRCETQVFTLSREPLDGASDQNVFGIFGLNEAQNYICIYQNRHT